MTYVSWAVLYEGATDASYYDVLIPRLMEELVTGPGGKLSTIPADPAIRFRRGTVETVARNACEDSDSFLLIFTHDDTGGRALEQASAARQTGYCEMMAQICEWPAIRCVNVSPRHETEAWILADPAAVADALGYRGPTNRVGLPADARSAERLVDPKATLNTAVRNIRGRRALAPLETLLPAIAQRQSFDRLRGSDSFRSYEDDLRAALQSIGCIERTAP